MATDNRLKEISLKVLLILLVLTAFLILPQNMMFSSASAESIKYSLSVSPTRVQMGLNTNITVGLQEANASTTYTFQVNVTAPNDVSYISTVTVVTNGTGAESNLTEFWKDFAGANTDILGTYNVTLLNITGNETLATANFTVAGLCEVQTRNLAGEPLAEATVKVYNATSGVFLNLSQKTNQTGWASFLLDAENYTFKAFWKDVEVGVKNESVAGNVALSLAVSLSTLKVTVKNESGVPISLVDLYLKYNYTTWANKTISETGSFTTNINGIVQLQNTFTNISYQIDARNYGFLFNTTFIENLPAQAWNNITIIAPTYTVYVRVLDSQNSSAVGLKVEAYEWSSGIGGSPLQLAQTDSNGNVTLSMTVGRYRLRIYDGTTFVDEATVNLGENPSFIVIRLGVYNINLSVQVIDYFGQPIPNVSVVLQQKSDSDYRTTQTGTTGSTGVASFNGIVGGDSRVYVSVAGRLGETQSVYLDDSEQILFKMDRYVAVVGYALETSQFVTLIILLMIIIAFIVVSTYKRLPRLLMRRRK